jgi:Holliday junction resolvasome RuvABC endonuclease subunit
MKIPVLGMDPSLRHWGLSEAELDLSDGVLTTPLGSIIEPRDLEGKNIRVNMNDQWLAEQLAGPVLTACRKARAIFVEVPVGSQSARAMASYGVCVGILGAVRALGIPYFQVSPNENKRVFTGNSNATKKQMITKLIKFYPEIILPQGKTKGSVGDKAEHIADATASIHSGVNTPEFRTVLEILRKG